MRRRTKILSLLAAAAVTSTAVLSGCSLVATKTQADMEQVIATVDITKSDELDSELADYTGAITGETEITKRDLVAYFISAGSTYLNNGYSYGETFEALAEALVDNEILIQYAVMQTLYDMEDEGYVASSSIAVTKFTDKLAESEEAAYIWLLDYQATILNDANGTDIDYSLLCKYSLYRSINNSIDSYEEDFLDIDDDDDSYSATLPTNVDTEVYIYYPVTDSGELDYGIYTGYAGTNSTTGEAFNNLKSNSGAYEEDALEGSTKYSRAYSYNQYIQVLDANYLILDGEDVTDVENLNYVKNQYITLLREQVVSNYYDIYDLDLEAQMSSENYQYVKTRYNELVKQQSASYTNEDTFSSALSNMSSSSFILYTPDNGTFGYVYNILAPFSTSQSDELSAISDLLDNGEEDEYYYQRNQILKRVTTYDQRSDWFNGGIDYSFDASNSDNYSGTYYSGSDSSRTTLFFKDNLTNSTRYESLENYYGKYTFNGTAVLNADGETYTIITNKLDIDGLLTEFESYLSWVIDDCSNISGSVGSTTTSNYYETTSFTNGSYTAETDGIIDYSKFIYATGEVALDESFDISDLTNINSGYYTIMSAVNELQYAYTTDTSILSTYVGYSTAYTTEGSTGYVLEFEYAAKDAIERAQNSKGAGTYCVVATDYGWHLIYVTATLKAGETYTPDWTRIETEGTFEYNFYQMLKDSDLENASTLHQQNIVVKYYNDTCVTINEDAYEDLTSLTTTLS